MTVAAMLQRLVEDLGTCARVDEKGVGGVECEMKTFIAVVRSQSQAITDTVLISKIL